MLPMTRHGIVPSPAPPANTGSDPVVETDRTGTVLSSGKDRPEDASLAVLGHEFRTPLATALNALETLRILGGGTAEARAAGDVLERQLRFMTRLVEEILDLSRLTTGKVELRPERLDLGRLVQVTAEDRRPTLTQAGLVLAVETAEEPLWVMADPVFLARVLNNLLDNAAKFTDAGGRVTVRVTAGEDRRRAVLTVRDTGAGIESDLLSQIFVPFAQAERTRHRARGGLGLGLALVKALVEQHGGDVTATSAGPGQGAEFHVRLPLAEPSADGAATGPNAEAAPGEFCLFSWRSQARRR
jgi:signal transduction histidine kinase